MSTTSSTSNSDASLTSVLEPPALDRSAAPLDGEYGVSLDRDSLNGGSQNNGKVLIPAGSQAIRIDAPHSDVPHSDVPHIKGHQQVDGPQQQAPATQASLESLSVSSDGTLVLDPPVSSSALYLTAKRLLDIAMSALLLVLLSPVLLISALVVKLTDGGSVFYPHTRVGEGGNEFTCYKFRSMVVNAEKMKNELAFFNSHNDHRTFKIPNDPRVTWIGRWMRRTSIDELPQLLNVLKGEMSIVGPRPPVVSEVEQYTWDDMQRLVVKPGLTCIWQVSGRSRLPFPEQLKLDIEYIENRNMALDLKLIALTIPAVLSADGAY